MVVSEEDNINFGSDNDAAAERQAQKSEVDEQADFLLKLEKSN